MGDRPREFALNYGHPLAQGLVFAGLGRNSGSTHYRDSSVYRNHGTLTNMEPDTDWVWISELGRWAIAPGGTNEAVIRAWTSYIAPPLTLAAWFLTSADGASQDIVALYDNASNDRWMSLNAGMNAAGDPVRAISYNATAAIATVGTITTNTWTHGVAAFTSTVYRMAYKNGVAGSAETTSKDVTGVDEMGIGCTLAATAARPLTGRIADAMVWNRILNDSEIALLADRSKTMLGGLILPPKRRLWSVPSAAPPATTRAYVIGGGVI